MILIYDVGQLTVNLRQTLFGRHFLWRRDRAVGNWGKFASRIVYYAPTDNGNAGVYAQNNPFAHAVPDQG